jgi:hypothetical protein
MMKKHHEKIVTSYGQKEKRKEKGVTKKGELR